MPFAHPGKNAEMFPVEAGAIVVDFGAGSGAYTFEIAKTLNGTGKVYAIDVQQELLRRIGNEAHRLGVTNIETIWGDIARPHGSKIGNASVDVVLMSNILFQLEHPKEAFDEARRILKLPGKLIIIDWIDALSTRGVRIGPTKSHVFSKDRALEFAEAAGFHVVDEFSAGAHHYGLTLQKAAALPHRRSR